MPAERASFALRPRGPYSLARTSTRFARFPEPVDVVEDGAYRRLLVVERRPLLVAVRQEGPPSRALLRVSLRGRGARSTAARAAAQRLLECGLGAGSDLREFRRRFRDDPLLGEVLPHHYGLRVAGTPSVWEALVTTVLCQQVNLAFAFSIRAELARALGRRARFDRRTYLAFPEPARVARLSEAELRGFRLSGAKAGTLARLARAFADGTLGDDMLHALPDEDVIERLCAIKGVGRWTAEVVLMRGLARLDAFPAADLAVVKYLGQRLLGRADVAREQEMRAWAERWRPYRSLGLVYALAEMERRKRAGYSSSSGSGARSSGVKSSIRSGSNSSRSRDSMPSSGSRESISSSSS